MENVKKINDQLTIAGQVTPEQLQEAAQEGFKSVLNLRSPDEKGFLQDEAQLAESAGLQYVNIPVKADEINDDLTTQVLKQIDELPKPALIHCGTAMRAGAMAFMNLATRQSMTPQQAFEKAHAAGFNCEAYPKMKQFFEHYVSEHSKVSQ